MDEFGFIKENFLSFASPEYSLNLADDAAILPKNDDEYYLIAKDCISENVHFFSHDEPKLIAKKLFRTNISDIHACGGKAEFFLVGNFFSSNNDLSWRQAFVEGLAEDANLFNVQLLGGDINVTASKQSHFSLTMIGAVPKNNLLRRSCAKVGDLLCISGEIGKSYLGLLARKGSKFSYADDFEQNYLVPPVRNTLAKMIAGKASACIDISDGLIQDLTHIADNSKVGIEVDLHLLQPSKEIQDSLDDLQLHYLDIINKGDDYELAFTIKRSNLNEKILEQVCVIGQVVAEPGVRLINADSKQDIASGFNHSF